MTRLTLRLWLALFLLALACAPAPGVRPSESGTSPSPARKRITAAIQGQPVSVIYAVQTGAASNTPGVDAIEEMVAAGMTHLDAQGKLVPQLAEAIPTTDNGLWRLFPDGRMETTWRLREGARWHDGTPLTSDDLLFSTQLGRDPDLAFFGHVGYGVIESVEAPDPSTVTVRWRRPFITADLMFSSTGEFAVPLPRHLLETPYRADKASLLELPYWNEQFVGSGPYRVRQWEAGSHMVLEAFDGYPLGRPRIDEIVVRFILDQNALVTNILAGEVEVTLGKTISLEQGLFVRDQWTAGRVETALANWLVIYPQFLNPSPPAVARPELRRALVHATNRQQIVDTLMSGGTSVADTFVNPAEPEYREVEPAIVRYPFDERRAAQVIEGLGYARGGDGLFRDPAGERLEVELRTDGGNDLFQKSLLAVSDDWRRAGVSVAQVLVPPQRSRDREYAANYPGFALTRNPTDLRSLSGYHSSNAHVAENNYRAAGGVNRSRYANPDFDALIDRYLATVPRSQRMELARQVIHHMTDVVTTIGLFYDVEPTLIASRLHNVGARPKHGSQGWNSQEWDLR